MSSASNNTTVQASEILERAADKLDRDGWARASVINAQPWRSFDGIPTCALGAIFYAAKIDGEYGYVTKDAALALVVLERAMPRELRGDDGPFSRIWRWNDHRAGSRDEVTSMLRAVAASLRAASSSAGDSTLRGSTVATSSRDNAAHLEHQ